jgi:hypothetical protein
MDLAQFSLDRLRQVVESGNLLPSERILAEQVPQRLGVLKSMGIENLKDLVSRLSTRKKLVRFAEESGIPEDYLIVLRRRAGLYTPRPTALKRMPGIDTQAIERLAALGIKDSKQLFDRARTAQDRAGLAREADVPREVLLELCKLSDLVRAPYVGPVFARLFLEAGTDTLAKLVTSNPEELCGRMRAANDEKALTTANLPSPADMAAGIEIYRMIPMVIEW